MNIEPLGPPLGAMVSGWDPGVDLAAADFDALKHALADYLVLVFRGHRSPTDPELVRFAAQFGTLFVGGELFGDDNAQPEILPISNVTDEDGYPVGTGGAAEFPWHIDYSYMPYVAKESFLDAVELPKAPSRTYFCSLYHALETLPQDRRDALDGLQAQHGLREFFTDEQDIAHQREISAKKNERNARRGIGEPHFEEYVAVRPVLLAHPETGRHALYVSPGNTSHIDGVPDDEGRTLLSELFAHATRPENVFCHEWQIGDLLVFDSFGGLHRRDRFDCGDRRYMRQLSTLGQVAGRSGKVDVAAPLRTRAPHQ